MISTHAFWPVERQQDDGHMTALRLHVLELMGDMLNWPQHSCYAAHRVDLNYSPIGS